MNLKVLLILLVLSEAEDACKSDSDCLELNSCIEGVCKHKALIPLGTTEYIGLVVLVMVSTIANAGGVGGSSMTISLMLILYKFDAHSCVALTQVFIFAGTATATALKLKDRHPTKDRPLIYYDVLMLIVSPILVGVSIGVILNPSFPSWLILAMLTIIVVVLVWDVLNRSFKLYKKEKIQSESNIKVVPDERENSLVNGSNHDNNLGNQDDNSEIVANEDSPQHNNEKIHSSELNPADESHSYSKTIDEKLVRRMATIYQEEKKIISWVPFAFFLVLASVSILYTMIKGSSTSASIIGIKSCSANYFGVNVVYFGFMILMNFLAGIYLVRKTRVCEQTNYVFDEGDIRWNYTKASIVSLISVGAGIVVGLLGMGGGNLIGPLLLALGVRPEISTISSSFSIFISSGTAAAQYFITGVIDFSYAAWFFALSVIGSLMGILILRRYAIRKQRVSLLIFCLAIILGCSLVIIPTIGIITAIKQSRNGTFQLGFKSIC